MHVWGASGPRLAKSPNEGEASRQDHQYIPPIEPRRSMRVWSPPKQCRPNSTHLCIELGRAAIHDIETPNMTKHVLNPSTRFENALEGIRG